MDAVAQTKPTQQTAPAQSLTPAPVTARDTLTPLFFFRRRALIAFVVTILLALIAAALAPKFYVADTRLLILLGDDYTAPTPLGSTQQGQSYDRTQIVKAETEILGSRELAAQTITTVGLHRLYPKAGERTTVQAAVERFQRDLTIENIPQSNVMNVSLRNGDPVVAADALNRLVHFYLAKRPAIFEQVSQGSVDRQTQTANRQLAQADLQIAQFSSAHGFGDYQLELTAVSKQQADLKAQLNDLDRQWADRMGQWTQLQRQKAATPQQTELTSDYSRPPALEALEQGLAGLEGQRRAAAQEYVGGSPLIKDLDERIAGDRAQIATMQKQQISGARRGLNPLWQDVNIRLSISGADLAGLTRARQQAQEQLNNVNRRLDELVTIAPRYHQMVRDRDLLATTAADLAKQDSETQLRNTLSRIEPNVRVLQSAVPPIHGRSQRVMILAAGLVLGLTAAAAVVVLSVAIFQGMLTPQDVEHKLAVPVVLVLNDKPEATSRPSTGAPPGPAHLTVDHAEMINHLVHSMNPTAPNSVQLIGPDDGVGVTSLVLDLALLSETARRKVLIIDAEPLKGRSVADLLTQRGAVLTPVDETGKVVRVNASNLFVTALKHDGASQMSEQRWQQALAKMRGHFDLILIDSPALMRSPSGLLTAPCVDLTLAVVESEQTHTAAARNMIERIAGAGGTVTAAIFNKRRFYLPKAIYDAL